MSDTVALRLDPPPPSERPRIARMQRSRGRVEVELARREGRTAPVRLYQEGALQARLPTDHGRGCLDVTLINLGGGLVGGDRLTTAIRLGADTVAGITSQAAEKVYRTVTGPAVVRTHLEVGDGAWAEWLPQETILFEGADLDRCLVVDLAASARLLLVETVVFGRLAMGEVVERLRLRDRIELRVAGRLAWLDVTALAPPVGRLLDRAALGGGLRALATVVYAGSDAGAALPMLRDALRGAGVAAAATRLDQLVVLRLQAPDPLALRRALVELLAAARAALGHLPARLPRLWHG